MLRKYGEADGCLFQLLAGNELWATVNVKDAADAVVVGVGLWHARARVREECVRVGEGGSASKKVECACRSAWRGK